MSFDYIHTSVKLIMQIASMSKGMKLQEHQILYMFAIKLKELCNKLGVHIDSSTQLNGEYKNARDKDETLLRGTEVPVTPYPFISGVFLIMLTGKSYHVKMKIIPCHGY